MSRRKKGIWLVATAALCAVVATAARAEDVIVEEDAGDLGTLPEEARSVPADGVHPVRLRLEGRFVAESDFGPADADFYSPRMQLRVTAPVSERAALRLVAEGEALFSDWDGVTDLFDLGPARGDPFDTLVATRLALQGRHGLGSTALLAPSEDWAILAEAAGTSNFESGADFGESLAGGGSLGIGYRIPELLDLVVGAGVASRLDRSRPRVFPVASATLYPMDDLRIRLTTSGGRIDYWLTEDVRLFARVRVQSERYRLERRAGPVGEGTLRDRRVPAGLGLLWTLNRRVRMSAFAGAVFAHQFRSYDDDRDRIDTVHSDVAPFFELRLDLRP